jgi:hypothetical protein
LTGWFGFHFSLIVIVCLRATFSIFAKVPTVFPASLEKYWRSGESVVSAAIGERLAASNPLRNGLAVYLHSAGIEAGYSFFAPNVPDNYTLVFEVHYPDGRVEYDLPNVRSATGGLRLNGLLDQIGATAYEPLRQTILKILTYSVWQVHPEASKIRAIFTSARWPSTNEFEHGQKESYELLYAYDFTFKEPKTVPAH